VVVIQRPNMWFNGSKGKKCQSGFCGLGLAEASRDHPRVRMSRSRGREEVWIREAMRRVIESKMRAEED
jgi:hypothetical protein